MRARRRAVEKNVDGQGGIGSERGMSPLPFPLADILEQEYVRLHGADGDLLRRRWELIPDEITNGRELARQLAQRLTKQKAPEIHSWRQAAAHDPIYKQAIAEEINRLLTAKKWLFDQEKFEELKRAPYNELGDVDDFLDEICTDDADKGPDGVDPIPDAIVNLNRQMFDELFHDQVRPAAESRLAEIIKRIHHRAKNGEPRTGLAISGGGIRSATFALGILQGLARKHILEAFDFLSTVSGGGYIGSWLSSWARRDPWGIRGVAAFLASPPSRRLDPEPAPIRHLRVFSNYLTPRLGAFSADTWALIATYLRNLVLNWLVLVPLLAALVAMPRLLVSAMVHNPGGNAVTIATGVGLILLAIALLNLVYARPISDWKKRSKFTDGKFLLRCLLPFLASSAALILAWAWLSHPAKSPDLSTFMLWTTILSMVAFGFFVVQFLSREVVDRKVDDREHGRLQRIAGEVVGSLVAGGVAGTLVWLAANKLFEDPLRKLEMVSGVRWPIDQPGTLSASTAAYATFGIPVLLGILFLQATIFVGIAGKTNHDFDREWWARASGWVLAAGLVWIILCAVTIYGPVAIYYFPRSVRALGGAAGIFSLLVGWSAKTKAKTSADGESAITNGFARALSVTVPLFVLFLLAMVSLGTTKMLALGMPPHVSDETVERESRFGGLAQRERPETIAETSVSVKETLVADLPRWRAYKHLHVVQHANPVHVLVFFLGSFGLALAASWCIGVNVFSMHAMYRNRLVRAYLGASRWNRAPNAFTGFDPHDNLFMHELRPEYLWYHSFRDLGCAVDQLERHATAELQTLYREWTRALGKVADQVLRNLKEDESDPAFYQAFNVVIATADLAPAGPQHEVLRPLRNRRFIERAFGDEIYPSPMPLLCVQDLRDWESFPEGFRATPTAAALKGLLKRPDLSGTGDLLAEINEVIATADLRKDHNFQHNIDVSRFSLADGAPVHRMIENRLRIDAALAGLIVPLQRPKALHLIDICLNLSGGEQLAWQERKGESFTVSPLAAGSHILGYRDTRQYGEISLGTAVTISGAAASPNMGYHSSPALAFLMTLFNVRLGWWLGNPGLAGNGTYMRRNPRFSLGPLVHEATGNTNEKFAYVYLSDGGHFENLGLYELVLRRCHCIVVSDAGSDPKYAYDDLGNAVRKIRVDLGIEVEITKSGIIPPSQKKPGKYCAVGTIHYPAVDGKNAVEGEFLYIKPVVYDDKAPQDVLTYSKKSAEFPHESTADQWFSESQFESYRRLGSYAIEQICAAAGKPVDSVCELIEAARRYLSAVEEKAAVTVSSPEQENIGPSGSTPLAPPDSPPATPSPVDG